LAARGGDDPYASVDGHVDRGLAERRAGAPDHQCLALDDLEVAEEAGPRGRVGLGNCSQLCPGQIRLDERDIRGPRAGVFGVAAIDGAAEAAHQRRHLGPDGKLAAGAGLHQPDALDAAHFRGLGPLAPPHVHLGVVDAERLDLDDDVTRLRLRVGNLLVNEAVEASELLQDDCAHDGSPGCGRGLKV
jgi:hypothetical protein